MMRRPTMMTGALLALATIVATPTAILADDEKKAGDGPKRFDTPEKVVESDDDDDAERRESLKREIMAELDARLDRLEDGLKNDVMGAIEEYLDRRERAAEAAPTPRLPDATLEFRLWFADGWSDFDKGWRSHLGTLQAMLQSFQDSGNTVDRGREALAGFERTLLTYERSLLQSRAANRPSESTWLTLADGTWAGFEDDSWRAVLSKMDYYVKNYSQSSYAKERSAAITAMRTFFEVFERSLLLGYEWKPGDAVTPSRKPARAEEPMASAPSKPATPAYPTPPKAEATPPALPSPAPSRGGFLGISLGSIDESDPEWRAELAHGLLIVDVLDGTAADRAGLKEGDVVVAIDDEKVTDIQSFVDTIAAHAPGDRVTIRIFREGWQKELHVKLGKRD